MNLRRLVLGFSSLATVGGLLVALLMPGGWLSDWAPRVTYSGGVWGFYNNLNVKLGFAKSTVVPLIGFCLLILGAMGLVVGWSMRDPREPLGPGSKTEQ